MVEKLKSMDKKTICIVAGAVLAVVIGILAAVFMKKLHGNDSNLPATKNAETETNEETYSGSLIVHPAEEDADIAEYKGIQLDVVEIPDAESQPDVVKVAERNKLREYLLENCFAGRVPEDELKARLNKTMQEAEKTCKEYYEMSLAEYYNMIDMTEEEYLEEVSDNIENEMEYELILAAIGDKEGIVYDEDAFLAYVKQNYKDWGYESVDDYLAKNDGINGDNARRNYYKDLVMDHILESADISHVPAESMKDDE